MTGEFDPMRQVESEEREMQARVTVDHLGNLGELVGNSATGAIESSLSPEELTASIEAMKDCFSEIDDHDHLACIDGRRVIENADGTAYSVRYHQAGADLAAPMSAILGGYASLPDLQEGQTAVDALYAAAKLASSVCLLERSSHTGGCGAANKAVAHLRTIAHPQVKAVTVAVLEHNREYLQLEDTDFDSVLEVVAERAQLWANRLEDDGWDGNKFTERALTKNSAGVEVLETAEDATHGHHEGQIAIVVSEAGVTIDERKLTEKNLPDAFVVDLRKSREIAVQLASVRGQEGYAEVIVGNIAWHIAVASVLCGKQMPVTQFNYTVSA